MQQTYWRMQARFLGVHGVWASRCKWGELCVCPVLKQGKATLVAMQKERTSWFVVCMEKGSVLRWGIHACTKKVN